MTPMQEWAWTNLVPTALKRGSGGRTLWAGLCFVGDVCADMLLRAAMSGMILTSYCTEDALALVGRERRLPRYPGETVEQYRARVHDAWDAWEFAGSDKGIIGQMQAAGYAPVQLWLRTDFLVEQVYGQTVYYRPSEIDPPEMSSFILKLTALAGSPEASCPVCGDDTLCSEELVCGSMLTYDQVGLLSAIVKKFKPAEMICKAIYFTDVDDANPYDLSLYPSFIVPVDTPRY
jgi:hypothetical protein